MTENVRQAIDAFVLVDDEITELNKQVKTLRDKRKGLEETILGYMESNELTAININGGSIKTSVSAPTSKKVSKKEMLPILIDHNIQDTNINSIIEGLFESGEPQEKKTKIVRSKK
jgi:sRNA-binding carbon storage regulator CsrA